MATSYQRKTGEAGGRPFFAVRESPRVVGRHHGEAMKFRDFRGLTYGRPPVSPVL
jgi:hypothetical protein